ncbi:MAG: MFS transporter [Acidimicrobiia bacterium]|nr:MFS transporter [Acidimicrobiia bacterium]
MAGARATHDPGAAAGSAHEPPARGVTFWLCAYALLVLFMGTNMPSPLYRVYQGEFGFSPLVVTLVFAVYVAALIPSLLLFGPLSDVIGRRRVLVPAFLLAVLGAAVFALADGTGWLYAARVVQGVAMGLGSGALTAAMAETEPTGDRARAVVVATGCIVVGAGGGPLVAGLLAEYAPWPLALVYLVEIVAIVPALYGVSRLPDVSPAVRWRPRRPQVPRSIREPFATASVSSFLAWAVTALFLTLVPSYASALAGTANVAVAGGVVSLLFAASAVVQLRGQGQEASGAQRRGLGLLVVGLVLLVTAGEARSLPLLLVATVGAGLGQGLAFLGAMTAVSEVAPADRHADIMSTFYLLTYVGTGAPVIGVGLLATRVEVLPAVEVFAGALAVLCLAAFVRLTLGSRGLVAEPSGMPTP